MDDASGLSRAGEISPAAPCGTGRRVPTWRRVRGGDGIHAADATRYG